jgi:hypothetical protein
LLNHTTVHCGRQWVFSVSCVFISFRLVTAPNTVDSPASRFMSLLASDYLTTNLWLQMSSPSQLLETLVRFSPYGLRTDLTEHTASNSSSVVACITVAVITWWLLTTFCQWMLACSTIACLPCCDLAVDVSSCSRILALSPHVTIALKFCITSVHFHHILFAVKHYTRLLCSPQNLPRRKNCLYSDLASWLASWTFHAQ